MKKRGLCPKCGKKIEGIDLVENVTGSWDNVFDSDSEEYDIIDITYQGCCPICGYKSRAYKIEENLYKHFSTNNILSKMQNVDF